MLSYYQKCSVRLKMRKFIFGYRRVNRNYSIEYSLHGLHLTQRTQCRNGYRFCISLRCVRFVACVSCIGCVLSCVHVCVAFDENQVYE